MCVLVDFFISVSDTKNPCSKPWVHSFPSIKFVDTGYCLLSRRILFLLQYASLLRIDVSVSFLMLHTEQLIWPKLYL